MERCAQHITNAYYIPNVRVSGYSCATNLASNTSFRGFGAPQGMFFVESIIDRVSRETNVDPNTVRENNFFVNGQTTTNNQLITNFTVKNCWNEVLERSEYAVKLNEVDRFNRWIRQSLIVIHFIVFIRINLRQQQYTW